MHLIDTYYSYIIFHLSECFLLQTLSVCLPCYVLLYLTYLALTVIAPPTPVCYECGCRLVQYHSCEVRVYRISGAVTATTKITLRCTTCCLVYNYSHFGNKHQLGFRHYPTAQPLIEATDGVYFERNLMELQCSLS